MLKIFWFLHLRGVMCVKFIENLFTNLKRLMLSYVHVIYNHFHIKNGCVYIIYYLYKKIINYIYVI